MKLEADVKVLCVIGGVSRKVGVDCNLRIISGVIKRYEETSYLIVSAGERGDVDRGLLRAPAAQDLHRVEVFLRVEFGKLKEKKGEKCKWGPFWVVVPHACLPARIQYDFLFWEPEATTPTSGRRRTSPPSLFWTPTHIVVELLVEEVTQGWSFEHIA